MKIRDLLGIDYLLLFAAVLLTFFGILFIYSSGINAEGELVSNEYQRQIIWASIGIALVIILSLIDYHNLYDLSIYAYAGILILLAYTCFFGNYLYGARRAVGIGIFSMQPGEFAKIITILFLARYLDSTKRSQSGFARFAIASLIAAVPMGLIMLQPDLGTALVFIPVFLTMIFIAGFAARYIWFIIILLVAVVLLTMLPYWEQYILQSQQLVLTVLYSLRFVLLASLIMAVILGIALLGLRLYKKRYFYWIAYSISIALLALNASYAAHRVLKEYQVMRLIVFLNPNIDPRGAGWNIIQSMIAIGSGSLWGKGFLQGTHSHYSYLPEQSTDFIFSIFGEEFGFMGGVFVFALFLIIALRMIRIMKTTVDTYGLYICAGISAMYIFHFLVNIGMTMGIMPITGIPLYFMSYGGSALLSAMAGIGLSMSVYIRRFHR